MRVVGPPFLPWVQEVIWDEEVAVIFLKEFWPQVVGGPATEIDVTATSAKAHSGDRWVRSRTGTVAPEDGSALTVQSKRFLELVAGSPRLDFRLVGPRPADQSG